MELNIEQIQEIIPHRPPFLLVDKITDYVPGEWAKGIKNARFKKQVRPGDVLELSCELIERRGPVGFGKAVAKVDGKVAAQGELTFAVGG